MNRCLFLVLMGIVGCGDSQTHQVTVRMPGEEPREYTTTGAVWRSDGHVWFNTKDGDVVVLTGIVEERVVKDAE